MGRNQQDTLCAIQAVKAIIDGRDPVAKQSEILVTAEHAVASLLLMLMGDPRKAAAMLNEGLVQGVEERLSLFASKGRS